MLFPFVKSVSVLSALLILLLQAVSAAALVHAHEDGNTYHSSTEHCGWKRELPTSSPVELHTHLRLAGWELHIPLPGKRIPEGAACGLQLIVAIEAANPANTFATNDLWCNSDQPDPLQKLGLAPNRELLTTNAPPISWGCALRILVSSLTL